MFLLQVSVWLQVSLLISLTTQLRQAAPAGPIPDDPEVRQINMKFFEFHSAVPGGKPDLAKQEFLQYFKQVLNGYLSEIAPKPVTDTQEVKEAKEEFFRVFDKALSGMIEVSFSSDTEEVKEKKESFLRTFDSAVDDLFATVEGFYTPEQVKARNQFQQAYKDASDGKVGAQYIEYTAEVKAARERFFKFFQFVLDGMLHTLSPKPGYNEIPEAIADFYIKDDSEVAEAKKSFDKLYRDALAGDLPSAIAYVALEEAVNNNKDDVEAAAEELEETLNEIADAVEEIGDDDLSDDSDYSYDDNADMSDNPDDDAEYVGDISNDDYDDYADYRR